MIVEVRNKLVEGCTRKLIMSGPKKKWSTEVAHLPYDLVFKILLLLPAKVLYRFSFVCKTWYNLINSQAFIEAHLHLCETNLVFLNSRPISKRRPNAFSIETKLGLSDDSTRFSLFLPRRLQHDHYIHFLEFFQDGKGKVSDPNICGLGKILATCNGLILATTEKNQGLLVMNPMTRKLIRFPLGTIVPSTDESYGFVFDQHKREYKVVHLFRDSQRFIGCEVLSVRTRSWRAVDGPSSELFRSFERKAVTATGALYWLPAKRECSYLVSLGMDDEKFVTRALPVNNSTPNDNLVEIGGFLSYVAHVTKYRMQIWILKGNEKSVEDWAKQYTINMDRDIRDLIPLFATRNGTRLVFKRYTEEHFLYAYDFQDEEMKEVELEIEGLHFDLFRTHLPHLNTLASWVNVQPSW